MNLSLILGILPLLAFVVIDMFLGLKAGVISAIILAILEAAYSFYELGALDYLSIASMALVLVFGGLSYLSKNPLYIKLQPVLLGVSFSVVVFLFQAFGEPILIVMLKKYGSLMPKEFSIDLSNPFVLSLLRKTSLYLGFGLFVHALMVLYSALKLNNWWWLFMRGVGLYLILALTFLIARFA